MKTTQKFFSVVVLLSTVIYAPSRSSSAHLAEQDISPLPKPLATETFQLTEDMEVGLEIEAKAPGASWARKGAEASALLISVDGTYNQDLLLWAGDEFFKYRVMLGSLRQGKHTVSVALNPARSAAEARRAEVKALRPLQFATARGGNLAVEDRLALTHSPVLYARANTIDHFTDLPLLMYYEILHEGGDDLIVRYTAIFTNEDGGTQTAALMARWGLAFSWQNFTLRKSRDKTVHGLSCRRKSSTTCSSLG